MGLIPQCSTQRPPCQDPTHLVYLPDLTSEGDDDEFLSSSWQFAQWDGMNKRCEPAEIAPLSTSNMLANALQLVFNGG